MKHNITYTQDNLTMVTTLEKYVLSQLTITIKDLADTNKIITEQVRTQLQQTH